MKKLQKQIQNFLKQNLKIKINISEHYSCDANYPEINVQLFLADELIDESKKTIWSKIQ